MKNCFVKMILNLRLAHLYILVLLFKALNPFYTTFLEELQQGNKIQYRITNLPTRSALPIIQSHLGEEQNT